MIMRKDNRLWIFERYCSMDGSGIDVWVGSGDKKIDAIMCIVDLMKRDSEIKILIGCTEEEKLEVYKTHNETRYMREAFRYVGKFFRLNIYETRYLLN